MTKHRPEHIWGLCCGVLIRPTVPTLNREGSTVGPTVGLQHIHSGATGVGCPAECPWWHSLNLLYSPVSHKLRTHVCWSAGFSDSRLLIGSCCWLGVPSLWSHFPLPISLSSSPTVFKSQLENSSQNLLTDVRSHFPSTPLIILSVFLCHCYFVSAYINTVCVFYLYHY